MSFSTAPLRAVTVLDDTESALETVRQRYPGAANIYYRKDSLAGYAAEACAEGKKYDCKCSPRAFFFLLNATKRT